MLSSGDSTGSSIHADFVGSAASNIGRDGAGQYDCVSQGFATLNTLVGSLETYSKNQS